MATSTTQQPRSKSETEAENETIVSEDASAQESALKSEESPTEQTPSLAKDDIFHILQNERRRQVLRHLLGVDETVEMREIAEKIAAWENDTTVANLYSDQRQRVYIALYQSHLPKLDDLGVINYNQSRGTIEPTALLDDVTKYLDAEASDASGHGPLGTDRDSALIPPVLSVGAVAIVVMTAAVVGLFPVSVLGLFLTAVVTGIVAIATSQVLGDRS